MSCGLFPALIGFTWVLIIWYQINGYQQNRIIPELKEGMQKKTVTESQMQMSFQGHKDLITQTYSLTLKDNNENGSTSYVLEGNFGYSSGPKVIGG